MHLKTGRPIGSASHSRNLPTLRPTTWRAHPRSLVQLGNTIAPRADEETGANHQAMLRRHAEMVRSQIANGLIEGIDNIVQAAKVKARGYCSLRNLVAIIYLIAGT